jgi:hypothetical protein
MQSGLTTHSCGQTILSIVMIRNKLNVFIRGMHHLTIFLYAFGNDKVEPNRTFTIIDIAEDIENKELRQRLVRLMYEVAFTLIMTVILRSPVGILIVMLALPLLLFKFIWNGWGVLTRNKIKNYIYTIEHELMVAS